MHCLGRALGLLAAPGDLFALHGPLGAGKTVLVKGIASGLGIDPENVTSPTFTLIHEYRGQLPLFHIDAYRLQGAGDLAALGAEELFFGHGVTVIEWADRVCDLLPAERLDVLLSHVDESTRRVQLQPRAARYEKLAAELAASQLLKEHA